MADDEVGKIEVRFGRILPHKEMGLRCSVAFSYRTEAGAHHSVELDVFVKKKDDSIPELRERLVEEAYAVLEHVLSHR
jgi:hypothetical protein